MKHRYHGNRNICPASFRRTTEIIESAFIRAQASSKFERFFAGLARKSACRLILAKRGGVTNARRRFAVPSFHRYFGRPRNYAGGKYLGRRTREHVRPLGNGEGFWGGFRPPTEGTGGVEGTPVRRLNEII